MTDPKDNFDEAAKPGPFKPEDLTDQGAAPEPVKPADKLKVYHNDAMKEVAEGVAPKDAPQP